MVKAGESLTDIIKESEEKDGFASGPVAPVGASLGSDGVANAAYELMGGGNSKTSIQAASASSDADKQNLVKIQELNNQQKASAENAGGKKKEDFASIGNVGGTVSTLALPASTSLGFSLIGGKRKTKTKGTKQTRKKSKIHGGGAFDDIQYDEKENKVNFTVEELTFYLDLFEKKDINDIGLKGSAIIIFYLNNKDKDFFKTLKDSKGNLFLFREV